MSGRPTGRRPGQSDTRQRILTEARELFGRNGFAQTPLRSVAAAAWVDVALISHYFGNKRGLFLEAVQLPVDPDTVLGPLADAPEHELGSTLVRQVLTAWESPAGPAVVAAFRTAMSGEDQGLLREFVLGVALVPLRERLARHHDDIDVRLALVASQIAGLLAIRKVIGVDPLASMPVEDVVRRVGPTVQRYLTGDLD
ncbi:TetR/AcrR family transcriptional regulator [Luteipulveratus halotolerans]|uniref:TetR family transcriptional regulator n=1 Tax=Luteipulveratus halotolerans TaxID=1631356 RepID=A0A0L6CFG1_9MICO|nr:TetR family transcriptional regulator [Luteipulveratus halotolerans]KNX36556.1 TetR family transcriptional regulator [Luteipulveratus halotolerans]